MRKLPFVAVGVAAAAYVARGAGTDGKILTTRLLAIQIRRSPVSYTCLVRAQPKVKHIAELIRIHDITNTTTENLSQLVRIRSPNDQL